MQKLNVKCLVNHFLEVSRRVTAFEGTPLKSDKVWVSHDISNTAGSFYIYIYMYLLIFIYIHIRFGIFTILYRKKAKKKKREEIRKNKNTNFSIPLEDKLQSIGVSLT